MPLLPLSAFSLGMVLGPVLELALALEPSLVVVLGLALALALVLLLLAWAVGHRRKQAPAGTLPARLSL